MSTSWLLQEVEVPPIAKVGRACSPVALRGLSILTDKEERARNPRTVSASVNWFQLTLRKAFIVPLYRARIPTKICYKNVPWQWRNIPAYFAPLSLTYRVTRVILLQEHFTGRSAGVAPPKRPWPLLCLHRRFWILRHPAVGGPVSASRGSSPSSSRSGPSPHLRCKLQILRQSSARGSASASRDPSRRVSMLTPVSQNQIESRS